MWETIQKFLITGVYWSFNYTLGVKKMAKICPLSNNFVLYLDCLECEYKTECMMKHRDEKSEKKLEKDIDKRG